jgi:hypothetical protein
MRIRSFTFCRRNTWRALSPARRQA